MLLPATDHTWLKKNTIFPIIITKNRSKFINSARERERKYIERSYNRFDRDRQEKEGIQKLCVEFSCGWLSSSLVQMLNREVGNQVHVLFLTDRPPSQTSPYDYLNYMPDFGPVVGLVGGPSPFN